MIGHRNKNKRENISKRQQNSGVMAKSEMGNMKKKNVMRRGGINKKYSTGEGVA